MLDRRSVSTDNPAVPASPANTTVPPPKWGFRRKALTSRSFVLNTLSSCRYTVDRSVTAIASALSRQVLAANSTSLLSPTRTPVSMNPLNSLPVATSRDPLASSPLALRPVATDPARRLPRTTPSK